MAKTPAERILCCKWISVTDFGCFDAGMKKVRSFFHKDFVPQSGINEGLERLAATLYQRDCNPRVYSISMISGSIFCR